MNSLQVDFNFKYDGFYVKKNLFNFIYTIYELVIFSYKICGLVQKTAISVLPLAFKTI